MSRLTALCLFAALALVAPCPTVQAAPPVEYAARHILVSWRNARNSTQLRTKEEARERCGKALAALKGGTSFEEVSHAWSDDKVSDESGGFLGFFAPTEMDPRFSAAVAQAKEGEVVGPVESDFGFHVIQRLAPAEGVKILAGRMSVVRGAVFSWKALPQSTSTRSKELALEDASRAITALAGKRDFAALPDVLGARSFPSPDWRPGLLRRGMIQAPFAAFEAEAFALAVGALSTKPVETPLGWVIVERLPYYRIHVEHLVVLHKDAPGGAGTGILRTNAESKLRAAEALAKLKLDPTTWPAIVAAYSDEPGAGERQGSLGGVEPGSMVPEFEHAFLALPPGGFSDLVETPFGWHVIRRVD